MISSEHGLATASTHSDIRRHETRDGPLLALAEDVFIGRSLELYGEYGADEFALLAQLIRPGMTIVEVGANIGAHAVPLARLAAPARIYCFEPQQRIFQLLCANLALNGITNALCYPEGVGETLGFARIPDIDYARRGNFGGVSLSTEAARLPNGRSTPITTVDALDLPQCGLIKIDVEGWEAQVLRGATATVERCKPAIYVENDRAGRQQEIISILDGFGYQSFWHVAPLFNPKNFRGEAENVFGMICSLNMLAVPKAVATGIVGLEAVDPASWRSPITPVPEG